MLDLANPSNGLAHPVGRNGKAHPNVVTDTRGNNTDEFSAQVNNWTSGVTWTDGCIGLNKILVTFEAGVRTMQSAHDSMRDGCSHAERIAESNEVIPNLYPVGITHRDRDKVGCSYPDHRNVRHRITGNSRTMNPASISEVDGNIVRVFDDVIVRHDKPLAGINNHASRLSFPISRTVRSVWKLA